MDKKASRKYIRNIADLEVEDIYPWPAPLRNVGYPGPYCIPQELLTFEAQEDDIFKFFFKGTSKEVSLRQIYMHVELSEMERKWLADFRKYCIAENFEIPEEMVPIMLRFLFFNWRKFKEEYLKKSIDHASGMIEWRQRCFPLDIIEENDLKEDIQRGCMYWTGRDHRMRPLLVVRLARLPRGTSPGRFKRLVVFCFEWALRYLLVPGKCETCSALLDVRGVPIHAFPVSALTDMTTTLTKQYPFRLDRMWIINDSLLVQSVWAVCKSFLTEVQQQKMQFFRYGYEKELAKEYALHQLEKCFGGTRDDLKEFYPFPLAPGPFSAGWKQGPDLNAPKDLWKVIDDVTMRGQVWENNVTPIPTLWSPSTLQVCSEKNCTPPSVIPRATIERQESKVKRRRVLSRETSEVNGNADVEVTQLPTFNKESTVSLQSQLSSKTSKTSIEETVSKLEIRSSLSLEDSSFSNGGTPVAAPPTLLPLGDFDPRKVSLTEKESLSSYYESHHRDGINLNGEEEKGIKNLSASTRVPSNSSALKLVNGSAKNMDEPSSGVPIREEVEGSKQSSKLYEPTSKKDEQNSGIKSFRSSSSPSSSLPPPPRQQQHSSSSVSPATGKRCVPLKMRSARCRPGCSIM